MSNVSIAVIGASGYTGADLVRLAARHPGLDVVGLTANAHAGKALAAVYPHLGSLDLPDLSRIEDLDWRGIDAVICGLPHGTSQPVITEIFRMAPRVKIIDLSADFRLRNIDDYSEWYGKVHQAPDLQTEAVYGLTEYYRQEIATARLIACPGCYPTAVLLALRPGLEAGLIEGSDVIIDAKSGISGAGRAPKETSLFCETGEGLTPYAIAKHRHAVEIEQELALGYGQPIMVNFTPHLVPMSRGELITAYVKLRVGADVNDVRAAMSGRYQDERFIHVLPAGQIPATQHVRGSNYCHIAVFADRLPGRAIIIAAIDNLVKGSSGQALQNLNVVFGYDEGTGLGQLPLFP